MSEQVSKKLDRRTFLKVLGAGGISAAFISSLVPTQTATAQGPVPVAAPAGMKTMFVYTVGPGANRDYKYGDSVKFLPPEKIPTTGAASDTTAALPKAKLETIYRRMNLSRKWETKMKDLFVGGKDGLYGSFHNSCGEEGAANGVTAALNDDDFIASTHRGHHDLIAKGGDVNRMSAEIFFKEGGYNKAFGGSMHITDLKLGILGMNGIVGAAWPIAAGAAYSTLINKDKKVAVALAGDGSTNSIYFFISVRNAVNYKLPAIFVIYNNQQAIAVPIAHNSPTKQQVDYVKGLGLPCNVVDGNDVTAVYTAMKEAVDRARAGDGPSVLELMTYRWYDHSGTAGAKEGVDGAFGLPYRTDDEVKAWMSRDPIARFKTWLLDKKLFTADELKKIEDDAQAAVDKSIEFARTSPKPANNSGLKNVYATGEVAATQFFDAASAKAYQVQPASIAAVKHVVADV